MTTTLEALRSEISALQSERDEHLGAGPCRSEVKASLHGFAEMVASIARHRLANHVAADDVRGAFLLRPGPDGSVDIAPLLAALLGPDVFVARLSEFLHLVPVGIDAAEKRRRITEIDADLDRVETLEEREVMRLEADGQPVIRRSDARPEIVLAMMVDAADDDAPRSEPISGAGVRKSKPVQEPRQTRSRSAYLGGRSE